MNLVCLVYLVIIITGLGYSKRSCFKKRNLSNHYDWKNLWKHEVPQKVAFSEPNMCNICCNNENRCFLVKSPLLKKILFSVHSMFSRCSYHYSWVKLQYQESSHKVAFSGPSMFSTRRTTELGSTLVKGVASISGIFQTQYVPFKQ